MLLPPQSRYRFYGSPQNYFDVARDVAGSRVFKGDDVSAVESRIAALTGVEHAIAVAQARFGLYLILKHLIEPGASVVMSPYTIYDVVNMVVAAGGRPVFADIDRETCNISAREVARLVDANTGAVLVTHLHGLSCDIEQIADICSAKGVPLIEDAAQAFGGRVDGKALGSFGDAAIFSFGRAKNVNAFYGGMVLCKSKALNDAIRQELDKLPLEDFNRLVKRVAHCMAVDAMTSPLAFSAVTFWIFRYGCLHDVQSVNKLVQTEDSAELRTTLPERYFRRITPMQARLVTRQIDRVEPDNRARLERAAAYDDGLKHLQSIMRPPLRTDGSHIYLSYPIQVPDRWDLVKFMMRRGRDVSVQHIMNTAALPCFAPYARECHNAQLTADQVVLLPTYPGYKMSEVRKTISVVNEYFTAGS